MYNPSALESDESCLGTQVAELAGSRRMGSDCDERTVSRVVGQEKSIHFPGFSFFSRVLPPSSHSRRVAPRLMSNRVFGTDSSLPVRASDIGEVHFLASHDPIADKAHSNPEEAAINGGIMMRYILFFATLV